MTYYKWMAVNGPTHGVGTYDFSGGWQPRIDGKLVPCVNGYHVCREQDLAYYRGDGLIEVGITYDSVIECSDKMVCRSWRLVRRLPWSREDLIACILADADAAQKHGVFRPPQVWAYESNTVRLNAEAAIAQCHNAERYLSCCQSFISRKVSHVAIEIAGASADIAAATGSSLETRRHLRATERDRQRRWILDRIAANQARLDAAAKEEAKP